MMSSIVKSYVTILYGGRALDIVGDTMVNPGYPEMKPVVSYSLGSRANVHASVDLTTNIGKATFKVIHTQEMADLIEQIKIENLRGVTQPLTCIDSTGQTEVYLGAFISNSFEKTYGPQGEIPVEFTFEAKDF